MRIRYHKNLEVSEFRESLTRVPKNLVDCSKLEKELTLRNGAYWTAFEAGLSPQGESEIVMFHDAGSYYLVPRHYSPPFLAGKPVDPPQGGSPPEGGRERKNSSIFASSSPEGRRGSNLNQYKYANNSIILRTRAHVHARERQQEAISSLIADRDDKILVIRCGGGKTVISLLAAVQGGRAPVLVVVHTNALADQWEARINQFLDLEPEDVGRVQGSREDWQGRKIVVAMLQTLVRRKFSEAFYRYFDLVVFDECHRLGAEGFSKACSMFPCERWGLSATITRSDGNDLVFRLHLGDACFVDLEQPLKPRVFFVHTEIDVPISKFINRMGKVAMSPLTTWISDHEKRNKLISRKLEQAAASGRKILVLGERLVQLHEMYESLPVASKGIHVGSSHRRERREALTKQVVFATQQIAKEGLDQPDLDTLFILVPFGGEGRLQQSLGRILRESPGKKSPMALIFVDNAGILDSLARRMERWCDGQGYEVKHVRAWKGD